MKAIVTGAGGFVGSHLVRRLIAEGLRVACLVRPTSDLAALRDLDVEILTCGLDDAEQLTRALAGADFVFHVAGLTRGRSAAEYMAANAEPTRRIVEAAVVHARTIRRFVYVSSLAAVGPNPSEAPVDESSPPQPADDYGRSKLAGERIVMEAAGSLSVAIVRPPGVYGPRDTNFLPLFRVARRWGVMPVIGGGAKQVSLVHADDLAEGIWLAASSPATPGRSPAAPGRSPAAAGQTYFIASGTYTMTEFAEAVAAAMGRGVRLVSVPRLVAIAAGEVGQLVWALSGRTQIVSRRKVRDLLRPRWTCSWEKAARELGYRPRISLAEGVRQTCRWYETEGWVRRAR